MTAPHRPAPRLPSENPAPCAECGEWMRADALVCNGCGQRFVARAMPGLAKAVPWDAPPRVAVGA